MDIATRFQPRARAQSFLNKEKAALMDEQTPEPESATRRKFQRTNGPATDSSGQFRKPSLPASATRRTDATPTQQRLAAGSINGAIQRQSSVTSPPRRKASGVTRENTRVPSGPREYPGSPGKRNTSSSYANSSMGALSAATRSRPSLLPASTSEPYFGANLTHPAHNNELTRGTFAHPSENVSEPTTPASQRGRNNSGAFEFLPTINFDEFQTSLGTLDTGDNYRPDLLDDFPAIGGGGGRVLRSDTARAKAMATASAVPGQERDDTNGGRSGIGRPDSFRQRLPDRTSRIPSDPKMENGVFTAGSTLAQSTKPGVQAKLKRQSMAPGTQTQDQDLASRSAQRQIRASMAPYTSTFQTYPNGTQAQEQSSLDLGRSNSLVRARRITMNPTPQITEKPRASVTNGSKAARTKPPLPLTNTSDPNTPTEKPTSKGNNQTPSSSGNGRRQSIAASGRASGLGARTISPTDARRAKRMSVAPQQPPMPASFKPVTTPGEEIPSTISSSTVQQHHQGYPRIFELPQLNTVPNPSFIPTRKDSSSLASSSARASPSDGGSALGKFGYPFPLTISTPGPGALSSKSSYASLHTATSTNTAAAGQSRVPVPKSRSLHSSATTTSSNDEPQSFEEFIPPVPAIPRGYESPKDNEIMPFGRFAAPGNVRQGSIGHLQSSFDEPVDNEFPMLGVPLAERGRSSFDSDRARHGGPRKSILTTRHTTTAAASSTTQPQWLDAAVDEGSPSSYSSFAQSRLQPDGRQNSILQPLRLPPLNLQPMSGSMTAGRNGSVGQFPRPSQELDDRDRSGWNSGLQTPDWSPNGHKTPSTPMTASKATFFRRQGQADGNQHTMRSSTSHFNSRDNSGLDPDAMRTGWLDDSDDATSNAILIPGNNRTNFSHTSRTAITPFASGSLPKGSGEYTRIHGRPSGEFADEGYFLGNSSGSYDGLRLAKAKTFGPRPSIIDTFGRSMSHDPSQPPSEVEHQSPVIENSEKEALSGKKEGGLRRKLSLGWRRSSSKAASRVDHHKTNDLTGSPHASKESSSMPPPRLPASAAFSGDGSLGISTSARPSLDGDFPSLSERLRRKHDAACDVINTQEVWQQQTPSSSTASKMNTSQSAQPKTRALHSERPQPVSGQRATSWSNVNRQSGIAVKPFVTQPRPVKHGHTPSTISALYKDQDDLAADEEMRKLTQKRKDVDNVAKQTEELLHRATPKTPIDLEKMLHDRHSALNIFERGEIVEYEAEGVYFTGTKQAKKIVGSLLPSLQPVDTKDGDKAGKATNHGYDDERGDYNIVFGDHLAYRYEVCDVLGKGSFGQVVRCIDHKDGGVVAVKIIRNKKRFHQQALVEVGILGKLREWDPDGAHATLSITGSFYFRSHLCIVTPCLSINLYELIRAHNFAGFTLPLIRRFSRQLLACLVLLQQKRVIHCDLKPENILLCSARAADVRVIDFGSSCREEEKVYTYIQSRFYRSPEVILGSSYGLGIDMWSFGCILAELWTGYPIFPGENEQDQLACIMEIFGPPDRHLVERCTRKKLFFDSVGKPRVTVSSKGRRRRPSSKTLQQALKTEDEAFVDFIARCLRWDPDRRMKPHEACSHAFITSQPLHQRPSIPDEARRTARVRSTAAVPATGASMSPVKRAPPTQAQSQVSTSTAATPQKATVRQMPDTPQTALRAPTNTASAMVSPAKTATNRRQSTLASAGGAAALNINRRQSSGAALAASMNLAMSKASGGSLAEKAARESMAATAAAHGANSAGAGARAGAGSGGRWRS